MLAQDGRVGAEQLGLDHGSYHLADDEAVVAQAVQDLVSPALDDQCRGPGPY